MTGLRGEVLIKAAPILNTYWRDMKQERRWQGGMCVTDHRTLQTESNEGVVGSVDNLDHDSHHSEDMIGIQRGRGPNIYLGVISETAGLSRSVI